MNTFLLHPECQAIWNKHFPPATFVGEVCACGHPAEIHVGMCEAGANVCLCREPRAVAKVSDIRYFFRATKGPHEAHALQLGLSALLASGGSYNMIGSWSCEVSDCTNRDSAMPVRMRGGYSPTLKLPVNDLHRFMCEECLFKFESST